MGTLAFKNFMIAGQTQDERRPVMNLVGLNVTLLTATEMALGPDMVDAVSRTSSGIRTRGHVRLQWSWRQTLDSGSLTTICEVHRRNW